MAVTLSWDLFVAVFFTVIIAYSFIIGKNNTLKIIIGTYVAVLAADGLGNLIQQYLLGQSPVLKVLPAAFEGQALVLFKIIVFIIAIVLIAVRGGFFVDLPEEETAIGRLIAIFCFGFLSAGLVVSTILVYVSGFSFVKGASDITLSPIFDLYKQSQMVQIMINNYNVWFSLPAIAFVAMSLIGGQKEK